MGVWIHVLFSNSVWQTVQFLLPNTICFIKVNVKQDIKCRYCISNYSMIVVKTFWRQRDKRSWPISLNLAIRNKEKAWEEIVSSFDSHIPHDLHLPTFTFSPVARSSCILFHQALVSPGRTQNRLAKGRERNRFWRLRFEPNDSTICIRLIIKSLLLTLLNRKIQSFQCMQ